jgi:hypothetical protein
MSGSEQCQQKLLVYKDLAQEFTPKPLQVRAEKNGTLQNEAARSGGYAAGSVPQMFIVCGWHISHRFAIRARNAGTGVPHGTGKDFRGRYRP